MVLLVLMTWSAQSRQNRAICKSTSILYWCIIVWMKKRLSLQPSANSNTASESKAAESRGGKKSDNLPKKEKKKKKTPAWQRALSLEPRLFGWKPIFDQPSWNGRDKWELQLTAGPVIAISSSGFLRVVNSCFVPTPTPPLHPPHSLSIFFTSTTTTPPLIPLACHFRLEISITLILPVCGWLTRKS